MGRLAQEAHRAMRLRLLAMAGMSEPQPEEGEADAKADDPGSPHSGCQTAATRLNAVPVRPRCRLADLFRPPRGFRPASVRASAAAASSMASVASPCPS